MVAVATQVCLRLVSDVTTYQVAMDAAVAAEPENYAALSTLAADIANVTPLQVGQMVKILHHWSERLRQARVDGLPDEKGCVCCHPPSFYVLPCDQISVHIHMPNNDTNARTLLRAECISCRGGLN